MGRAENDLKSGQTGKSRGIACRAIHIMFKSDWIERRRQASTGRISAAVMFIGVAELSSTSLSSG
jgi:hypothetical protein